MGKYSFRWGIELFDNAHTQIPNFFLKYYHKVSWKINTPETQKTGVGITNTEMMLIVHLASFKYESEKGIPSPSLTCEIKQRMNYRSNQGVINVTQGLIEKGLLLANKHTGKRSEYDFTPLSKKILALALVGEIDQEIVEKDESDPSTKLDHYPSTKLDGFTPNPSTKLDSKKSLLKKEEEKLEKPDEFDDLFGEREGDKPSTFTPTTPGSPEALGMVFGGVDTPDCVKQLRATGWKIREGDLELACAHFVDASPYPVEMFVPTQKGERADWLSAIRGHLADARFGGSAGIKQLYRAAWNDYLPQMNDGSLDITRPGSLTKKMVAISLRQGLGTDLAYGNDAKEKVSFW